MPKLCHASQGPPSRAIHVSSPRAPRRVWSHCGTAALPLSEGGAAEKGSCQAEQQPKLGYFLFWNPRTHLQSRMSSRGLEKTVPNSPCLRTACHPWLHDWWCALEFASGFAVSPSSMGFLFIEIQDQRKALSGGLTWYRKDSLLFSLADAPMVCIASPWSLWHPLSLCTRIRRSRATSTAGRTHYSLPTACQEHNAWTSRLVRSPPSFKPRPSLALISAIGS